MTQPQLISINVGKVQTYENDWTTAFFKTPVDGAVKVSELCVEGDEQHHKNIMVDTFVRY
jgi:MOSC domain-containing protein YiiM